MAYRCGFIGLVGRPNSGKSSLLNAVLGRELSIVTPLPQTTRANLRGIYTDARMQLIFIDTPGFHKGNHAYNAAMSREAASILKPGEADLVCYMVDLTRDYGREEDAVASLVRNSGIPTLMVFNKKDACLSPEARIGAFIQRYPGLANAPRVIISAVEKTAKRDFLRAVSPLINEGPRLFPQDELTDASLRFFAAEYLRKHIIRTTREEVPHAACVEIASYRETERGHLVDAVIHVETTGQRGIIIGPGGKRIQSIRQSAARDLAQLAGAQVSIQCHVKVSPHWRDNPAFLRGMGYEAAR